MSLAEREALAQVEAAGFSLVRSGAATFSLISENHVARFLANTLPRWRRAWTVQFRSAARSDAGRNRYCAARVFASCRFGRRLAEPRPETFRARQTGPARSSLKSSAGSRPARPMRARRTSACCWCRPKRGAKCRRCWPIARSTRNRERFASRGRLRLISRAR